MKIFFETDLSKVFCGDNLEIMKGFPDNSVDAVVTDPPYGLKFMGNKWDYEVPSVEVWKECLRILKPGGHVLVFCGTRTQHRMVCNIEDAGFEIRDLIAWVYSSGFPKSVDVSKAIDKFKGVEREVVGRKRIDGKKTGKNSGSFLEGTNDVSKCFSNTPITENAKEWEGWGTALKPAFEPITVARKPFSEKTIAENILKWGTGGINIDECRVNSPDGTPVFNHRSEKTGVCYGDGLDGSNRTGETSYVGRFPANFIHDGDEEVVTLFPDSDGQQGKVGPNLGDKKRVNVYGYYGPRKECSPREDSGSAARFFYCAKASRKDRDEGLELEKIKVLARSCQAIADAKRGKVISKGAGAFNKARVVKNDHPTVKPTALMSYLCKLVTPPGGTVCDPFMGSGSTGKAIEIEGFHFLGIDDKEQYCMLAAKRIKFGAKMRKIPSSTIFDFFDQGS